MSFGPEQFLGSLLFGKLTTLSEKLTEGKSGNFFFTTSNGLFMAKTISSEELNNFLKILPNYFSHVSLNPDTFLVRYYGLHKLNNNIPIVIMQNCFLCSQPMDVIYDLKGFFASFKISFLMLTLFFKISFVQNSGSSFGRSNKKGKGIMKDLDFMEQQKTLNLSADVNDRVFKQLQNDANFLMENGIIDYSLLLGIRNNTKKDLPRPPPTQTQRFEQSSPFMSSTLMQLAQQQQIELQKKSSQKVPDFEPPLKWWQSYDKGMLSTSGNQIYYFSIIDTLISFGLKKKTEHAIKSFVIGDATSMSIVNPKNYFYRFITFIKQIMN